MRNYVEELEKLRGLSILAVILIHSTTRVIQGYEISVPNEIVIATINGLSRFGVPCFVAIAGFLITRQELSSEASTGELLRRRVMRVLPPYIFWSSVYFLFFVATGEQYATHQGLPTIFIEKLITGTIGWQLYFLVLVLQYYVLSYLGLGKNGRITLLTWVVCGMAQATFVVLKYLSALGKDHSSEIVQTVFWYFQAYAHSLFPYFLMFFIFGRWLGANYEAVLARLHRHSGMVSIALLLSAALSGGEFLLLRGWSNGTVSLPPDWTLSVNMYAFAFILYALPRLRSLSHQSVNCLLIWLGKYSFVLYLLHEPLLKYVIAVVHYFLPSSDNCQLLLQPTVLVLSIAVSYAMYRLLVAALPPTSAQLMFGLK